MLYIRTAQGHSAKLQPYLNWELVLQLMVPGDREWVDEAVHGSKQQFLESILKEGMSTSYSHGPTARCHHHFAKQIRPGRGGREGVRQDSNIA
eukprot:811317-Alexandrium_andersonii.AAC.1